MSIAVMHSMDEHAHRSNMTAKVRSSAASFEMEPHLKSPGMRHAQLPCAVPGLFMRAELSRRMISCIMTMHVADTDFMASFMKCHAMSVPLTFM